MSTRETLILALPKGRILAELAASFGEWVGEAEPAAVARALQAAGVRVLCEERRVLLVGIQG